MKQFKRNLVKSWLVFALLFSVGCSEYSKVSGFRSQELTRNGDLPPVEDGSTEDEVLTDVDPMQSFQQILLSSMDVAVLDDVVRDREDGRLYMDSEDETRASQINDAISACTQVRTDSIVGGTQITEGEISEPCPFTHSVVVESAANGLVVIQSSFDISDDSFADLFDLQSFACTYYSGEPEGPTSRVNCIYNSVIYGEILLNSVYNYTPFEDGSYQTVETTTLSYLNESHTAESTILTDAEGSSTVVKTFDGETADFDDFGIGM